MVLFCRFKQERSMLQYFHYPSTFHLESGETLPELTIAYTTYGTLSSSKNNVIWICHALTANADPTDWWKGLTGTGAAMNPETDFIICANILGSCYGSTGPLSIDPRTQEPYLHTFPFISIRDMVHAHILLRQYLGIEKIGLLAGGSMGGYQALEWALAEPSVVQRLFLLATSAAESPWGIAIHTAQRMAIEADATWQEQQVHAGAKGLKAARAIGMITYRNYELFGQQQADADNSKVDGFKVSSYLEYQGEKLVNRFNAFSYWTLTRAMDSHNISRGRAHDTQAVLAGITQPVLLIGISSDILCPPAEQRHLASHLPACRYEEISSPYGHDGFLVESEQIGMHLDQWRRETD
jgi:homoserine O-acetyltransferase